ncbi:MAG TPA: FxSxx-COOH system tetratricopeptide repeat protein [Ktedonosporobacter sp.]|nr:FxSxx-COOH system tetratricopeptide repeat protein [Ktedonosporobacter sp.]
MERNAFEEGSFAQILQRFRQRSQLTQQELAKRIGVDRSTVSFWEREYYLPETLRVVRTIARVLKLDEEDERLLIEARFGTASIVPLHHLPESNPYFTGREEILNDLQTHFTDGKQRVQAISGLGGIGKTQIAIEYAYRFREHYHDILWAQADSREVLVSSYLVLAQHLRLRERAEKDQFKVLEAVKRWLREHKRWLLILDNIEDLALVREFVPAIRQGAVLLTTQREKTIPVARPLVLEMLSQEEGRLFLLKRAGLVPIDASPGQPSLEEKEAALAIAHAAGGLPLALDQAGAYIAETGCSLAEYADLFRREQKAILGRRGTVPVTHPQSVTVTFSLAFEQVRQKSEEALELLKLCAFLAADAIPLELVTRGAAHPERSLEARGVHSSQLDQTLEVLLAYSLIRREREHSLLSIHRLVQTVLQDTFEERERHLWAERAIHAVNAAFPHVEHTTWSRCEQLLLHVLQVAQHVERLQIINEEAGRLFSETAIYLRDRSRYAEAESLLLHALEIFERQLGPEHPEVAMPLNILANLYLYQGKYEQVEPLCKRALQLLEQHPEYPNGDAPLHTLATLSISLGKYELAEPPLLQALEIRKRRLGPEHLEVATSLNNLASLYMYQGKYELAESVFQQARKIYEQPPEHPNLAYVLNNLAELYFDLGNYDEAEPLFQRARRICEQQLGPEHHGMAYPLNGLANLRREQGHYAEAERLFQQALQILEHQLEPGHPDIAAPLHGLANLYREQGNYVAAEPLYERALHILEHVLGREQPETARVLHDLARLQQAQGNYEAAKISYAQAFSVRKKAFGEHHIKTQETRHYYIDLLRIIEQHEEATLLEADQREERDT